MKKAGQGVLTRFPQTNLGRGKVRPALLLAHPPTAHDDWLVCMIGSKIGRYLEGSDEIIDEKSMDFVASGLSANLMESACKESEKL